MITSSSTRDYIVNLPDGSTDTRTYQWRQTISFQSCQHDESYRDMKPTQMLNVDQIFVMYDSSNELIRFAMSNKIGDINGEVMETIPVFLFCFEHTSFLEYNTHSLYYPDQKMVEIRVMVWVFLDPKNHRFMK